MFQFTHPVWGATRPPTRDAPAPIVSIHAPRVGCDSPRVRRSVRYSSFQFTHPVWGATKCLAVWVEETRHVSIHAPRVGCDLLRSLAIQCSSEFQFTHPVWGATWPHTYNFSFPLRFNSRTPCGVRLPCGTCYACQSNVSIHAPRVGCDILTIKSYLLLARFNSRTPCGVRPAHAPLSLDILTFQFTHPVWGAT